MKPTTPARTRLLTAMFACSMLLFSTVLASCNTTEGAGKDIKAAGQGIENSAQDNKGY